MKMTHASVFSGIGGPEVAATMLGWENLFHCEINPFGRKVLEYWFPQSKSYEDITKTDFTEWRGRVNVLTGGFPCQPFSYAGQRRGATDDRYLWPHMFRCIDEIRPDWVVAENVAGILTMVEQGTVSKVASAPTLFDTGDMVRGQFRLTETFTLERISTDLESHGYEVQPILIPACAVGAPHRRDRVFIVGKRIASNTDNSTNGRATREDESKSGKERIQERHQVRESDEPNQIRREGADNVTADTFSGGERTPRKSCEPESSRSDTHQQPSEWGAETEWNNRFYAILRDATHPDSHRGSEMDEHLEPELANGAEPFGNGRERNATDTSSERPQAGHRGRETGETSRNASSGNARSDSEFGDIAGLGRWSGFPTVSPVHRGNDGLPFPLDDLAISQGKWRTESLKAYGNAIVPQVMYEIFRAIEIVHRI